MRVLPPVFEFTAQEIRRHYTPMQHELRSKTWWFSAVYPLKLVCKERNRGRNQISHLVPRSTDS